MRWVPLNLIVLRCRWCSEPVRLNLSSCHATMHPAQILAVKQEVLRADTRKLAPWAQQVLQGEVPAA